MTLHPVKLLGVVCGAALLGLCACNANTQSDAAPSTAVVPALGGAGARAPAAAGTAAPVNVSAVAGRAPVAAGGGPAIAVAGNASVPPMSAVAGGAGSPASPAAGSGGSVANASAGAGGMPSAGSAGQGASAGTTGAAGMSAANSGMASLKDCGEGATMGKDRKAATKAAGTGRHSTGSVDFKVKAGNRILRLQTTLEVPPKPKGNSTLFMWPGLEPLEGVSMNFNPIGRGVLQPVLTWGTSCAPGGRTGANNWWISGMYVNVTSRERGYNGCYGGKVMDVKFGDKLYMDMRLKEGTTIWNQKVTNLSNNESVDFDFDLKNQDQNWALFEIEVASSTLPSSDVIFTSSVLTWANPEPEACTPDAFGPNDYYTAPLISSDGTKCCLERIVLREMGVAATTMDP